jgi:hypothetical protein
MQGGTEGSGEKSGVKCWNFLFGPLDNSKINIKDPLM